jgi:hypothetical protein
MASFKITDLSELAGGSVNDSDVLEIVDLDADESKKVTIASLKTVFAGSGVSEGSSYTGGTSNGIMFNDGNTFATSSNLVFDGDAIAGGSSFVVKSSDGKRIFEVQNSNSIANPVGTMFLSYLGNATGLFLQALGSNKGRFNNAQIGVNYNPTEQFSVGLTTDMVGIGIHLSNGQTADAFQINSFGNTGGDVFRVDASGSLYTDNIYTTRVYSNVFRDSTYGNNWVLFTPINASTSYLTIGNAGTAEFTTRLKSGGFYDVTDGTNTMRYQGGSLGIGTTSPTAKLHVDVGNGFKVKAWSISGSYGAIANNSGFEMMRWLGSALYINYSDPLRFTFNDSERGRFSNTGFSVGTTSSDARFHLAAVTDEVAQRIDLSNGQTEDAFQINSFGNTGGDLVNIDNNGTIESGANSGFKNGDYYINKFYGLYYFGASNRVYYTSGAWRIQDSGVDIATFESTGVGIGTTSPDASSILDLTSTTQGALLPRMTTTERDAIPSPATGLLIFNTTTKKLDYYSGTAWGQV